MLAFDSNVLVHAEGIGDVDRISTAEALLRAARELRPTIPVQALGELFQVLVNKGRIAREEAHRKVRRYESVASLAPTLASTFRAALGISEQHRLQIFDAVILAASAEAGCRILLSEDMQDGFVWRGVTIVNPFAATPHPMLADLLEP